MQVHCNSFSQCSTKGNDRKYIWETLLIGFNAASKEEMLSGCFRLSSFQLNSYPDDRLYKQLSNKTLIEKTQPVIVAKMEMDMTGHRN